VFDRHWGAVDGAAVQLPFDPLVRRIARALIADPSDNRTLDMWGRLVGASSRTLARRFVAETGMTFVQWRTNVRLNAALAHLHAGIPVADIASRVG
jgi:AraC-like DNA-binding protein